jgi:putative transposase
MAVARRPAALPMARHRQQTSKSIALWRYEQIGDALGVRSREVRSRILREVARSPVVWPGGGTRAVSLATLYRWLAQYSRGGLDALRPATRGDKGKPRACLPKAVVDRAFALWAEDPEITFTLLIALLYADPGLALGERGVRLAKSTLQRRLAADPRYVRLLRGRKLERRRRRYVARKPHQIWHLDAKGPVRVRLTNRVWLEFHVLTILDDMSRAVLASVVALTPDLRAAVRVFRLAAKRWGLPDRVYADRASIFDSAAFRRGLAQLGSHRIRVKARNPEANGKIEAFHRVLVAWFTGRLKRQRVVDLPHLQQLLDGVLELVYQEHRHRGLKASPRQTLAEQVSLRTVSAQRLDDAFREERIRKAHPKTGEVDLPGGTFLVPEALRGQRLTFLVDPEPEVAPLVVEPGTERHLSLQRAAVAATDCEDFSPVERWGDGPLQTLYDAWQGKVRPVAEAGFGLPEVYVLLAESVGRPVPRSDGEAALVQRAYQRIGPLPKKATESAFRVIRRELGGGRPISAYLDALARRVVTESTPAPKRGHP